MAKVALVTGCSSGLGKALVRELQGQRQDDRPMFRVFASARKLAALDDLRADGIECVQLDVTNHQSVRDAVQSILKKTGRIDVLINNAGLNRIGPLAEQPLSEIHEVLETNLIGVLRVTQAVLPSMMSNRSGLVVMIGSVGSHLSSPFAGAYNASKAALLTLTDTLRLEVAPFNVGVTYVMAGAIKSNMSVNAAAGSEVERYRAPDSAYRSYVEGIWRRVGASQEPSTVKTAEATAGQIVGVVDRYIQGGGRKAPPVWFLAGGTALYYWSVGLIQKLFGWPTNAILMKKFGLDKPPQLRQ